MSVGLTRKSPIHAATLLHRPRRRERVGVVRPEHLKVAMFRADERPGDAMKILSRLVSPVEQSTAPSVEVRALAPARLDEAPIRLLPDGSLASPWDRLHQIIQEGLSELSENVLRGAEDVLTRTGLVSSPALPVFSYRTFYRRAFDEEDPIVVGVEIQAEDDRYRVCGEICGEDSGQSFFDEAADSSRRPEELESTVRRVVRTLVDRAEIASAALRAEVS